MRAISSTATMESVKCWICGVDLHPSDRMTAGHLVCPCCGQTLGYETKTHDGTTVVRLQRCHGTFEESIGCFCGGPAPTDVTRFLVVDLAEMPSVTSSTLAGLVALKRKVERTGGAIVLCGLQSVTRSIFEGTRLDRYFKVVDTVSAALKSIDEMRTSSFSSIAGLASSCTA